MHITTFAGFLASASIMVAAAAMTKSVSRIVSIEPQKWRNFSSTCPGFELVGDSTLRASCQSCPSNTTTVLTELDLNRCIGYTTTPAEQIDYSVNLAFKADGNFTDKCNNCSIDFDQVRTYPDPYGSAYLNCERCDRRNLVRDGSAFKGWGGFVNLDYGIGNQEGYLACEGGVGTLVSNQPSLVSRDVDAAQDSVWFSHNCKHISLVGSMNSTLRASCIVLDAGYGGTGSYLTTELDLNLCVGVNENAAMIFQVYGKLVNSCDQLSIGKDIKAFVPSNSPFLHGNCYLHGDHSQAPWEGNLDLDAGIGANDDGYLTCRGGQGTVVYDQIHDSFN